MPKPALKHKILTEYAQLFPRKVFVETGTWRGDAIKALLPHFGKLFTIDSEENRTMAARQRFREYPDKVICMFGRSPDRLPEILNCFTEPIMFWLDAHYVGTKTADGEVSTPLMRELDIVLGHHDDDVIIIDDARLFTVGHEDYYSGFPTIAAIREKIRRVHPEWVFLVEEDIIRTHRANDSDETPG